MKETRGQGENRMKFEWKFDEEVESQGSGPRPRRLGHRWFYGAGVLGLLVIFAVGGWKLAQNWADRALEQEITLQLIAEQTALSRGDVDLLRTLYQQDMVLFAAAFHPQYRAGYQQNLIPHTIINQGDEIWVTVAWSEEGETWQRRLFFRRQDAQLLRQSLAPAFWGDWQEPALYTWGTLHLLQADHPWQTMVAQFVSQWLAEQCDLCLTERLPIHLTLAPDWQLTTTPGEIRVPSPHLIALDTQGQPGEPFWQLLANQLTDYLTPARLRFAIPPAEPGIIWADVYEQVARQFTASQPHIQIELVATEASVDMARLLPTVDGAALPVDAAAIRIGLVQDLTDLAATDPTFVAGDFYEQIWQGALWQERLWLMPQSARLHLLFYDRSFYEGAGLATPNLDWTWGEWQTQMTILRQIWPPETLLWPYLDVSGDGLRAYAYNWDNPCDQPHTIQCPLDLKTAQIAAALSWYASLTPTYQPDLTLLTPAEQAFLALNIVSIPRQVAVWVSEPGRYELEMSLEPLGVTIFPGTTTHPGITPLQVQGSVISGTSTRPRAMWEWLKYLSYQGLARGRRVVPARPSVAQSQSYWSTLLPPLRQPMMTAFAHGRPILLDEQAVFTQVQLRAVLTGEMNAFAAAAAFP